MSTQKRRKQPGKAEDLSIPPVFRAPFYKLLAQGAQKQKTSRATFAMQAVQHYLKVINSENTKDTALSKALGSEELAKRYREANSKISKSWWSKVSEEEKSQRARKAVEARWGKKRT